MTPALVVGAGLSGLATAWHLADRGFRVSVAEAAPRAGGLIHTLQTPFGLVETGANAFVSSSTVSAWFERLNLDPIAPLPASRRRYIFRDSRPRRWPLTFSESTAMACRIGLTALTRGFSPREGESVAGWGDRVAGAAAREWLLEPAMQGVYAARSDALSARAVFGARRRGRPRMVAPAAGMGAFVDRLRAQLVDRGVTFTFGTPVEALEPGRPTAICASAPAAARLLARHAPQIAAAAAAVSTSSLATVTAFFDPDPSDVRGFGVLFPEASGVQALGVLFNTDIFVGRGASTRSETWIFGDRATAVHQASTPELLRALATDRQRLTGRSDQPLHTHVTWWPHAIPLYDNAIQALGRRLCDLPPWLALAGNYLGALGVSRLLENAERAAERLAAYRPAPTGDNGH